MTTELRRETYVSDPDGPVVEIYEMLGGHHGATYYLASSIPGERVELPPTLYRVLHQVVDALRQGLAVTVVPHAQTLTTQQAADLLGVSRPTVIKLLDAGRIPFERVGAHRRVLLHDLMDFRERRRAAQYAALEATAVDLDEEGDLESMLSDLREARRATAARLRAGTA